MIAQTQTTSLNKPLYDDKKTENILIAQHHGLQLRKIHLIDFIQSLYNGTSYFPSPVKCDVHTLYLQQPDYHSRMN